MTALEARFDTILPTLATKADVANVEGELIRWVAGVGIVTVTVLVSIMGFLFSRLEVGVKSVPQPAPIIIQVPSAAPAVSEPKK